MLFFELSKYIFMYYTVNQWNYVCVFFYKKKTEYDMRISDWSSDVCSSDLRSGGRSRHVRDDGVVHARRTRQWCDVRSAAQCRELSARGRTEPQAVSHQGWSCRGADLQRQALEAVRRCREARRSGERRGGKECGRKCR